MRRERRNFQGAAGYSVSNTAQPTKGKEIMGKRIEDLKETAPCGMLIHYTVNEEDIDKKARMTDTTAVAISSIKEN